MHRLPALPILPFPTNALPSATRQQPEPLFEDVLPDAGQLPACSELRRSRFSKRGTSGTREGSAAVPTSGAEVEAVGDSLNYMYLLRVAALAIAIPGLTVF